MSVLSFVQAYVHMGGQAHVHVCTRMYAEVRGGGQLSTSIAPHTIFSVQDFSLSSPIWLTNWPAISGGLLAYAFPALELEAHVGGFYLGSGDLSSALNASMASTSLTETSLQSECTQRYGRYSLRFSITSKEGRMTGPDK